MTFVQEVGHWVCLCHQSVVSGPSEPGAEGSCTEQARHKQPMTPDRVLTSSLLCPVQAICSRSPPSTVREGGFVSYGNSSQQMLLLAAV